MRGELHRVWFPVAWVVAALVAVWIYRDSHAEANLAGVVETTRHDLVTRGPGRLAAVRVVSGSLVRRGQVVAEQDSRELRAELRRVRDRLTTLERLRDDDRRRYELDYGRDRLELDENVSRMERQILGDRALVRGNRAEIAALDVEIARLRGAIDQGLDRRRGLADLQIKRDRLAEFTREKQLAINRQGDQLDSTRREVATWAEAGQDATLRSRTADRALLIQEVRDEIQRLGAAIEARKILAPVDGRVVAIVAQPGDVLAQLQPVVLMEQQRASRVDAYLPEASALPVAVGAPVLVMSPRGTVGSGTVINVSASYGMVPRRLSERNVEVWARLVRIALEPGHALLPGERVDVALSGIEGALSCAGRTRTRAGPPASAEPVETAQVTVPTPNAGPQMRAIEIPKKLKKSSDFEPSALLWLPDLEKYLIASDDTGRKHHDSRHSPWLFLMDREGLVERDPLVVEGIDSLRDVESIASGEGGVLYLVSSQSLNSQGKRPKARERIVEVHRDGRSLKAGRRLRLAKRLESFPVETLRGLGLDPKPGQRLAFDVEGSAMVAGDLYLGIKEPSTHRGALVWRIKNLDAVLDRRLLVDDIEVAAKVDLGWVGAERCGISAMAADGSGRFFVACTGPHAKDRTQPGACFRIDGLVERTPKVTALRAFPGHKIEGLALSPTGEIRVVTDNGSGTPWTATLPAQDGR